MLYRIYSYAECVLSRESVYPEDGPYNDDDYELELLADSYSDYMDEYDAFLMNSEKRLNNQDIPEEAHAAVSC